MRRTPAELHPLSAFLRPWFAGAAPDLARLNAAALRRGLVSGGGVPLRFVPACPAAESYERRVFLRGEVATRPDEPHDLFNALIWLSFPSSKAALNRRHVQALDEAGPATGPARGLLRDAITHFDECGVVVAGCCPDLWAALNAHRWQELFVRRRDELRRTTRFLVFGHASHAALAAPFVGLCGKALFLEVDAAWLALPEAAALAELDGRLAALLDAGSFAPRDWQPLPLLGIPGATAANEDAEYYADPRQFRPARTIRRGSSPGNR